MAAEMNSLKANNTWILVDLPPGKKPIQSKWVFKRKFDKEKNVSKYKARLVVKGFTQSYGIDYTETFSPVARYGSIRYLFALSVKYNLKIEQMDAVTAFLQGDLDEKIYLSQPQEFNDGSRKVCLLKKAIYGYIYIWISNCANLVFAACLVSAPFGMVDSDGTRKKPHNNTPSPPLSPIPKKKMNGEEKQH